MTREEKVLTIKHKISKEIDDTVPQLIKNLQWATNNRFASTSFSIFYKSSMILASLAELKQKLAINHYMFEQVNSGCPIVSDDTLDILLAQPKILYPILYRGSICFDYDDEYWEHEHITVFERIVHEKTEETRIKNEYLSCK